MTVRPATCGLSAADDLSELDVGSVVPALAGTEEGDGDAVGRRGVDQEH